MSRVVGQVLIACAVLFALSWPALFNGQGDVATARDTAAISDYRADFEVHTDGALTAVETVTCAMPPGKHGIFRFWDSRDPDDAYARLRPEEIAIYVDDQPAKFDISSESHERYVVAKIGDPARTLEPGRHVYRIQYRIPSVLENGSDPAHSVLHWSLIPGGWQMPIARAELHVHFPSSSRSSALQCSVGLAENSSPCPAPVWDTESDLTVRSGALERHTPLSIRATLQLPTPTRERLPWPAQLDSIFGSSESLFWSVLALACGAGLLGALLAVRSREVAPAMPALYAPPAGIGPAQSAYIMTERVPPRALVATLLYQAERKLVKLTRMKEGHWGVLGIGTAEQWKATDEVTHALGEALRVERAGGYFASDGSVHGGQLLQQAKQQLNADTRRWARSNGLGTPIRFATAARVLAYLAVVYVAVVIACESFCPGVLALPALAYAICGMPLFFRGGTLKRTEAGRALWSAAGGFRRVLGTESSEARFDFSGRRELYVAFIPWAVAFGCAQEWENKYRLALGEPPPDPLWVTDNELGRNNAYYGCSTVASIDSFESSLQSSIQSYEATQSSSSSDGGGSSGSGDSGGGGGSW